MTKLFFVMLSFFAIATMHSQEQKPNIDCTPDSPEYTARYAKLKEMYIEMQSCKSAIKYRELNNDFREKSNYDYENGRREIIRSALKNVNAVHQWALDNIEKTEFKDCEEAEAAIKNILDAHLEVIRDNKELYIYHGETVSLCPDLTTNLLQELSKMYRKNLVL